MPESKDPENISSAHAASRHSLRIFSLLELRALRRFLKSNPTSMCANPRSFAAKERFPEMVSL